MNRQYLPLELADADFEEITKEHSPDPRLLRRSQPRLPESGVRRISSLEAVSSPSAQQEACTSRPQLLLGINALRALLTRFTDDAGPAARPILLKEISKLGATTEQFPLVLKERLLAGLASRLDHPTTRVAFLSDARALLEELC